MNTQYIDFGGIYQINQQRIVDKTSYHCTKCHKHFDILIKGDTKHCGVEMKPDYTIIKTKLYK